ncbi:MAG: sel1 repeat family protein, partial [Myxococcales bacterium]|nr:sel1 repeat family protein [Myxococcales bacterium]
MRPTALALALGVALAVVATARIAHAVERPCPSGQIWDPNRGACVQKKKVKRKSPEDKYYEALEHLEGRAKNPSVAKAVALLEDACTRKLGEACTQLGFVYLRGRGVTADPAKAVEHYERACKLGDNDGCIGAADVYATGVLGKIDHGRAAKLLDGACKGGSGRACHELAGKYQRALGVAEDATKAAALYKQAFGMLEGECGKGVGASCDLVGVMYRDGEGATFDLAKAVAAFDRGCQGGAGDACYHLGALAQNGTGVPLDLDRAYGLYESACQRYDHQDSCFEAGAMLALGQVQRDLKVLEPMAQRACQLSQARCDLLGYILGDGIGVTQDLAASARWYDVACGQGNGVACRVMGQKYLDGTGVALNVKTAVKYWEQACDLSEGLGCFRAGQYHYWGDDASGLKVDQARAFELLHLACLRDDRDACQWAGELLTLGKDGTGVEKPEQGILYFQAGCQLGLGQSCSWAGELYLDGRATGTPDPGGAIEYLENGCFFDVEPQTYACHKTVELRRTGAGVAKDVAVAVRAQTKLCALGDAEECVAADTMIGEEGLGDDEKQALRATAEAACAPAADGSRNEGACVAIAWLMRAGSNAYAKDGHGAVARFEESCARGYQHACVLAGETYEFGLGVVANTDKARALYGGACDGGYQHACYSLANLLTSNGQAKEALGLLQTACDGGHASACNVLGFAYYTARGARWDVVEADRLYARACELGDAVGCSNVGEMYQYGIAHDPDPAKAFELYTKACDLGFAGGCGRSAYYLERGEGGAEKNAELAEARYTAACEGDSPEACRALAELLEGGGRTAHSKIAQLKQRAFDGAKDLAEKNPYYAYVLGTFHRDGVATVKDAAKAAELFVTACDGYDPLGCLAAGRLYMGTDVDAGALPPNPELAAVQLDKACAANVAVACRLAEEAHTGRPGAKLPLGPKKGGCACSSRGGA